MTLPINLLITFHKMIDCSSFKFLYTNDCMYDSMIQSYKKNLKVFTITLDDLILTNLRIMENSSNIGHCALVLRL